MRRPTWPPTPSSAGRYALQLKRVYDYFDRNQVLILQFERGLAEPLEQYHRTLEFIGLPPEHVPTDLTRTRGTPQSAKKEPFWDDFKEALVRELEPDVAELQELVPEIDLELWPNFKHLAAGEAPAPAEERPPHRDRQLAGAPRAGRRTSSASAPPTRASAGGTGCCSSTLRSRRPCAAAASSSSTSSARAR